MLTSFLAGRTCLLGYWLNRNPLRCMVFFLMSSLICNNCPVYYASNIEHNAWYLVWFFLKFLLYENPVMERDICTILYGRSTQLVLRSSILSLAIGLDLVQTPCYSMCAVGQVLLG